MKHVSWEGGDFLRRSFLWGIPPSFLVLLLCASSPASAAALEAEPNNDAAHAGALALAENPAGSGCRQGFATAEIDTAADVDYWALSLLAGDVVAISLDAEGSGLDARIYLRNAADATLAADSTDGPGLNPYIAHYTIDTSGTYYVSVHSRNSTTGTYRMRVDLVRDLELESDANDANDTPAHAEHPVFTLSGGTLRTSMAGAIARRESGGDFDEDVVFLGNLNAGAAVEIDVRLPSTSTLAPYLEIIDENAAVLAAGEGPVSFNLAADGAYYARISNRYWVRNGRRYDLGQGDWAAGEAFAQTLGGHLVTIDDADENAWLLRTMVYTTTWIGLNDAAHEGDWVWSSGAAVAYTNWAANEPGPQDYAYMDAAGIWRDGTGGAAAFVAESADPQGRDYAGDGIAATYILDAAITDPVPPRVTHRSRLPADGGATREALATFTLTVSEDLAPGAVNDASSYDLREQGADGVFDTGDDVVYTVSPLSAYDGGTALVLLVADGPLASGTYRFRINPAVTDRSGNAFDGNGDGTGGDAFSTIFTVTLDAASTFEGTDNETRDHAAALTLNAAVGDLHLARGQGSIDPVNDVDWWSFDGLAGDRVSVAVDTPDSNLDPRVILYDSSGSSVASDANGGPYGDCFISDFTLPSDGVYYIRVYNDRGTALGNYDLRVERVRGSDLESDRNYANDTTGGADAIALEAVAGRRSGKVAGTIMDRENGNADQDVFLLGELNRDNTVELTVSLPPDSTLAPAITLLDADGNTVPDEDGDPADAAFRATVPEDGVYYARIESQYLVTGGRKYIRSTDAMTWDAAEQWAATTCGGHLARIPDAAAQEIIWRVFGDADFWIGYSDAATDGIWVWADGSPAGYENWANGYPHSGPTYNYAYIPAFGGGAWRDLSAASTRLGLAECADPAARTYVGPGGRAQYSLAVEIVDAVPPHVTGTIRIPAAGGTTEEMIATFTVTVNENLAAASINAAGACELRKDDGALFDLRVSPAYAGGSDVSFLIADGPLPPGTYTLTLFPTITDAAGNALDGDGDGTGGDAYIHVFTVAPPPGYVLENRENSTPADAVPLPLDQALPELKVGHGLGSIDPADDEDYWSFSAAAGDIAAISVDTPVSAVDPRVYLYSPSGTLLTQDNHSGPDADAFISGFTLPETGDYRVRVAGDNAGIGDYRLTVSLARGIGMETDAEYANDGAGADPVITTDAGAGRRTGAVAGHFMLRSGSNQDEDSFALGTLNAGNVVELTVAVPADGTAAPRIQLLDPTGAPVPDEDGDPDDLAFRAAVTADGPYTARLDFTRWVRDGRLYILAENAQTWPDARTWAQGLGADLAVLDTADERDWVNARIGATPYWIGLADEDGDGVYTWVNGAALGDSHWAGGEPDADPYVYTYTNSYWYDVSATATEYGLAEKADPAGRTEIGPGDFSQYVLHVGITDPVPPRVAGVARIPGEGESTGSLLASFTVTLSEDLTPDAVNAAGALTLTGAGPDGVFDTGDDLDYPVRVSPVYVSGTEVACVIDHGPLPTDAYRLTIRETVTDVMGNPLDGDGDGTGGDPFVRHFTVALPAGFLIEPPDNDLDTDAGPLALTESPAGLHSAHALGSIDPTGDVDWWSFQARAGDRLEAAVTARDSGLDPAIALYRNPLAFLKSDTNDGPENGALISGFVIPADDVYYIKVSGAPTGDYDLRVILARGMDMETDAAYANGNVAGADPVAFTLSGAARTGRVAGTIMARENAVFDVDVFHIGFLNPGDVVTLTSAGPAGGSLVPRVRLLAADGAPVPDADGDSLDAGFTATITANGDYYAEIASAYSVRDARRYYLTGGTRAAAEAWAATLDPGAHLVTIGDEAENRWLQREYGGSPFWIGLEDQDGDGNWLWADGGAPGYTDWDAGEPHAGLPFAYASTNGKWRTANDSTRNAVVEMADPQGRDGVGPGSRAQYVLDVRIDDVTPPRVTGIEHIPADGGTTTDVFATFTVTFSEDLAPAAVPGAWSLVAAGPDGVLDTGDDAAYPVDPAGPYTAGRAIVLRIAGGPLPGGLYLFTVSANLTDRVGNPLDGDGDGAGGDPLVRTFTVDLPDDEVFEGPANDTRDHATPLPLNEPFPGYLLGRGIGSIDPTDDEDWWEVEFHAGDRVAVAVDTPGNDLDPLVYLYDDAGTQVASDNDDGPDFDAFVSVFEVPSTGTYTVRVVRYSGADVGVYHLRITVDRGVFLESDADYANGAPSGADAVPLTPAGTRLEGVAAGTIMAPENGAPDVDYFSLGVVPAGRSILLGTRLPPSSELTPILEIRDAANQVVGLADNPSAVVARADVAQAQTYFAVVIGGAGQGYRGQYLLDVRIVDTTELDYADLAVPGDSITHPASVDSGAEVAFEFTVGNYGAADTAVAAWSDRIALSRDEFYGNGDDIPLGTVTHTGVLAAGSSYAVQASFVLPPGVVGDFHVVGIADADGEVDESIFEANNAGVGPGLLTITPIPHADLRTSQVAAPEHAEVGDAVTIVWNVANDGDGATGDGHPGGAVAAWSDRVVLSSDAVYGNADDIVLGDAPHAGVLAPGADYAGAWTGQLPAGLSGFYYILVMADSADQVYEFADSAPNAARAPGRILVAPQPFADLAATLDDAPTDADAGQTVTVEFTVTNTTDTWFTTPATAWSDRIVLSTDDALGNADDRVLALIPHTGELAPGASYTVQHEVTLPQDLAGPQHLFVRADALDEVYEFLYEGNNAGGPRPIELHAADLVVDAVSANASPVFGETVAVSWTGRNAHASVTARGAWQDRVWLSADAVLDPGADIALGTAEITGPAAPGDAYTGNCSVTLPADRGLAPGDYHLIVEVNAGGLLAETDAGNNTGASAVLHIERRPAPRIVEITPSGTIAEPLTGFTVTFDAPVALGSFTADDVTVTGPGGAAAAATVHATTSGTVFEITLPPQRANGDYHVSIGPDVTGPFGTAMDQDGDGTPGETPDDVFTHTVTVELPDLHVTELTTPAQAQFGAVITVQYRVQNGGAGDAPSAWTDEFWLSTDAVLDTGTDIRLGTVDNPAPLPAGDDYLGSADFALPLAAGLAEGTWYVLVRTDANAEIAESAEDNNDGAGNALALTFPDRPDLGVQAVEHVPPSDADTGATGPRAAAPGAVIPVRWTCLNTGAVALTDAQWTTGVYLSPDNAPGQDIPLARFTYTTSLAPGESVARNETVALPGSLAPGTYYVVVTVDDENDILEEDETNNSGAAAAASRILDSLTLTVPASAPEGRTGLRGTVTRSGDATLPLTVHFDAFTEVQPGSADPIPDATEISLPNTVIIPAGASTAPFYFNTLTDGSVDGDQAVNIRARADFADDDLTVPDELGVGFAGIVVEDIDPPRIELTVDATKVREGESVQASVAIDPPADLAATVRLHAAPSLQVFIPDTVEIPAGASTAVFTVEGVQDAVMERPLKTVTLTARLAGYGRAEATLDVEDDDQLDLDLEIDADYIREATVGEAARATVSRSAVAAGALTVHLSASPAGVIDIPASVTIPANRAEAEFAIHTVDDNLPEDDTLVVITAVSTDPLDGFQLDTAFAMATVVVLDDDGPALALALDRAFVAEGRSTTATVQRVGADTTLALEVALACGDPVVQLPEHVTIPPGQTSAQFDVTTVDNGVEDGSRRVTLRAEAEGLTTGVARLGVTDLPLPDLMPADLEIPAAGRTGAAVDVRWTIVNQGNAAAAGPWFERIYLSIDDRLNQGDILVRQLTFDGALDPGLSYSRQASITLPETAAEYHLIVEVDSADAVLEAVEFNNARTLAQTVAVSPAYTATVHAAMASYVAGAPIMLAGAAVWAEDRAPAVSVPVTVYVRHAGTERALTAVTDALGEFTVQFHPLRGEGGDYAVAAAHPGQASDGVPDQDAFTIVGFGPGPDGILLDVDDGAAVSVSFDLSNVSGVPLTGITAAVQDEPANVTVQVQLPDHLDGNETGTGAIQATAHGPAPSGAAAELVVSCNEGATLRIPLAIRVKPLTPVLEAPARLRRGMVRGKQTLVEFTVTNTGALATGELAATLPDVPWMSLGTSARIPSLGPGESTTLTLFLRPPPTLPLGVYSGSFGIGNSRAGAEIAYEFRNVSDALGDLTVTAVDERTYHAPGTPPLAGASVVLRDPLTLESVREGTTDADGRLSLLGVPEGMYTLEVDAPKHNGYRHAVEITPGNTTEVTAFLSLRLVTYRWHVEPVELEDRYEIRLESVFTTDVPVPVVTIEPSVIDLAEVVGDRKVINMTIENHGLIAAQNLHFSFMEHPNWKIEPLVQDLGDLEAKSSITVPVTITRLADRGDRGADPDCVIHGDVNWELFCGPFGINYPVPCLAVNASDGCREAAPSGGGIGDGPPPLAPANEGMMTGFTPMQYHGAVAVENGDRCSCAERHFEPKCYETGKRKADASSILGKLTGMLNGLLPPILQLTDPTLKVDGSGKLCTCCKDGQTGVEIHAESTGTAEIGIRLGPGKSFKFDFDAANGETGKAKVSLFGGAEVKFTGTVAVSADFPCLQAEPIYHVSADFSGSVSLMAEAVGTASVGDNSCGLTGSASITASWKLTLEGDSAGGWNVESCFDGATIGVNLQPNGDTEDLFDPISASLPLLDGNCTGGGGGDGGRSRGTFTLELSPNEVANLLGFASPRDLAAASRARPASRSASSCPTCAAAHPRTPEEAAAAANALARTPARLEKRRYRYTSSVISDIADRERRAEKTAKARAEAGRAGKGICAQVRLLIEQEAVMTRRAAGCTLELDNGADAPLTDLEVDIAIMDDQGNPADDKFILLEPKAENMTLTSSGQEPPDWDIDTQGPYFGSRTWELGAGAAGSIRWVILPKEEAAANGTARYWFGGVLTYVQDGVRTSFDLIPGSMTVHPDAKLELRYFHQHDVFSDDPFTDEIEPAEPFDLAVLVINRGKGDANHFRIVSAQPTIIENVKGLLVNFDIISAEVAGRDAAPTLEADFGRIPAGAAAVGRWRLRSSLQGHFIDYEASFVHDDALGGRAASLIEAVSSHEMIKLVQCGGQFEDGKYDFLVNDVVDPDDLPDTLYLSNGDTAPVTVGSFIAVDRAPTPDNPEVTLFVNQPPGWSYTRIPDPGNGKYVLIGVRRNDGQVLPVGLNAWQTDRTFKEVDEPPVHEDMLHIFDYDGTGTYTLTYRALDDSRPTVVSVEQPPQVTAVPVDALDVVFSEPIAPADFTVADMTLVRDGGDDLLQGAQDIVVEQIDPVTFRVKGLAAYGASDGVYTFTVDAAGVTDLFGNPGDGAASSVWRLSGTIPGVIATSGLPSGPSNRLPGDVFVTWSAPVDLTSFDAADLTLTRDGGDNLVGPGIAITQVDACTSRISGLANCMNQDGLYRFAIDASGVSGPAGAAGAGVYEIRWTLDTQPPAANGWENAPPAVTRRPLDRAVVTFDAPLAEAAFPPSALSLTRNGGPNLTTNRVTIEKTGPSTYAVNGLGNLTAADGDYVLTLDLTQVTDPAGNPGERAGGRRLDHGRDRARRARRAARDPGRGRLRRGRHHQHHGPHRERGPGRDRPAHPHPGRGQRHRAR